MQLSINYVLVVEVEVVYSSLILSTSTFIMIKVIFNLNELWLEYKWFTVLNIHWKNQQGHRKELMFIRDKSLDIVLW